MVNLKYEFLSEEKKLIQSLSNSLRLYPETVAILFSRGFKTEEQIKDFLRPGKHNFINPFLLNGVTEAVNRLNQAKENNETVLIYGDYDADGICAVAIMQNVLTEFGLKSIPIVPERSDGYGLRQNLLDALVDNYLPDLLITVDCGISCYNEVEYLKDLGVDVIVTDHHELPDRLPDCTVINCKIPSSYGFDSLCGAGVAFKLGVALIGEKAYKYLDFAAIATIADSMPLIGENRDIVYEGIEFIKKGNASSAVKELISSSPIREINSTGLAFTVAPRINAAGRMGDANSALSLMLTKDPVEAEQLAIKLNSYNLQRQRECETLYKLAREKLVDSAYNKKIVILKDDKWNSGLVGIIAAKLVEEFNRPVILFVNNDGSLHGSARSIESVNIFEAVSACKDLLTDFGGHAQAAGVTLDINNYDAFCKRIEQFIDQKHSFEHFKASKYVDLEVKKPFEIGLAKQLNLLEPFGTGNKKPLFSVSVTDAWAIPLKPDSPHLSIKTDFIDMLYFNGRDKLNLLNSGAEKQIIFEPNISVYNREESLKGYIKDVDYNVKKNEKVELQAFRSAILTAFNDNDDFLYVSDEMTEKIIAECDKEHYGTIFAVYELDTLNRYPSVLKLEKSLGYSATKSLANNVVLGVEANIIQGFKRIFFLDRPLGAVPYLENINEALVSRNRCAFDYSTLSTDKQVFAEIFRKITAGIGGFARADESASFAYLNNVVPNKLQLVFSLEVFIELGIFYFNKGVLRYNKNIKSSLEASRIYAEVLKLKGSQC